MNWGGVIHPALALCFCSMILSEKSATFRDHALIIAPQQTGSYMRGMKVKEADILMVPGYTNSGPHHWQSRWQAKLSTARRVEQAEWSKPVREDWSANVAKAVNGAERPVVI